MSDITSVRESNGSISSRPLARRGIAPPVDVFENADELLIVADVPGVRGDEIDLRVENDMLSLHARRAVAQEAPPALVREYEEVDFSTTFRIPAGIDAAAIVAETKNGTLVVRLPKAAGAKPRKVPVR
ncbi:MAG: Hsp20/alpha crystallin family protein [Polyangiaceae bacterium]